MWWLYFGAVEARWACRVTTNIHWLRAWPLSLCRLLRVLVMPPTKPLPNGWPILTPLPPTRLAQFVTGYFDNAYQLLLQHEEKLTRNVIEFKSLQYQQLLHCNDRLVKATNQQVKSEQHQLEHVGMTIRREGRYRMNTETERWQYVATDLLKYSTQFLQEQKEALEQQPIHLLHQVSRVQREQDAQLEATPIGFEKSPAFSNGASSNPVTAFRTTTGYAACGAHPSTRI
jgi:hypothetical protein